MSFGDWYPAGSGQPVPPPNAPRAMQLGVGVQPGTTNIIRALEVIVSASGPGRGIFVYSPSPGAGNLIGSWTAEAGTDVYGNAYPAGLSVAQGIFSGTDYILNPSGLFLYSGPPTSTYGAGWMTF